MNAKIKLILGFTLLSLLLLGTIAYFRIERLESDTEWIDHSHQIILSLQKTYADLKDAQTNYAEYLLTQKIRYSSACEASMGKLDEEMGRAGALTIRDTLLTRGMGRLQSLIEDKSASMRRGLADVAAGKTALAVHPFQTDDEKKSDREIKDLVDQMSGVQIWLLKARTAFEQTGTQNNVRFMFFGAACTLLACGLAIFLINRQIRERQEALNRLKSSEEKFRFVAETANDAFITTDTEGRITDINPAGETMFGYSKPELVEKPISLLMPQGFIQEQGPQAFEKYISMTQGLKALELYGRRKDKFEFPLELSLSKWETREGSFYTTIVREITERKFFIKTLLNNEHRLFQFLDAIPAAIVVRDPSGAPYYANHAAHEMFGEEAVKSQAGPEKSAETFRLYSSETGEPYPSQKLPILRALAGEKSHEVDIEMRRSEQVTPLEVWGAPILDENGLVKFALTAAIDISLQKQILESLREREEFFRNLFEEGPIGMNLSFSDGVFVNVNRVFSDMLGYSKNELIGHSYLDFTFPEDLQVEKNLNQKLFDKILPRYQVEKRYVTKKGDILWCKVSASSIRDLKDEPIFRLAIVENITEQKMSDMVLKESEEKFRTLTESANDAIISSDSRGLVIFFNPTAEKIFGYTREEVIGRPISQLMSEESWKANFDLIQKYLASAKATIPGRTFILTGKRKSGEEFPAEISYFSWKTSTGFFFTSIMRDITERKQVEEMKNDLISVVSHQLKTPVAEINGYIENLLDGLAGELTSKQQEYLSDMREIGVENYRLISDLLSLSKIERGVITVNLKVVPLQQIIEASIRDYGDIIQRKNLQLVLEKDPGEIFVRADGEKAIETLRNIINNAIKCTDQGSITIKSSTNGDFGIIEIRDTGIGMGPEALQRLFTKERVMGVEASRSGAGLGLYIAKNFMKLQHGDIKVESEAGKGTAFFVKIPLAKGEEHV